MGPGERRNRVKRTAVIWGRMDVILEDRQSYEPKEEIVQSAHVGAMSRCPVQPSLFRRLMAAGFVFFLVKGLVWLGIGCGGASVCCFRRLIVRPRCPAPLY